jgi:hypothetical protein
LFSLMIENSIHGNNNVGAGNHSSRVADKFGCRVRPGYL